MPKEIDRASADLVRAIMDLGNALAMEPLPRPRLVVSEAAYCAIAIDVMGYTEAGPRPLVVGGVQIERVMTQAPAPSGTPDETWRADCAAMAEFMRAQGIQELEFHTDGHVRRIVVASQANIREGSTRCQ